MKNCTNVNDSDSHLHLLNKSQWKNYICEKFHIWILVHMFIYEYLFICSIVHIWILVHMFMCSCVHMITKLIYICEKLHNEKIYNCENFHIWITAHMLICSYMNNYSCVHMFICSYVHMIMKLIYICEILHNEKFTLVNIYTMKDFTFVNNFTYEQLFICSCVHMFIYEYLFMCSYAHVFIYECLFIWIYVHMIMKLIYICEIPHNENDKHY